VISRTSFVALFLVLGCSSEAAEGTSDAATDSSGASDTGSAPVDSAMDSFAPGVDAPSDADGSSTDASSDGGCEYVSDGSGLVPFTTGPGNCNEGKSGGGAPDSSSTGIHHHCPTGTVCVRVDLGGGDWTTGCKNAADVPVCPKVECGDIFCVRPSYCSKDVTNAWCSVGGLTSP
jgi:hypothetical protein